MNINTAYNIVAPLSWSANDPFIELEQVRQVRLKELKDLCWDLDFDLIVTDKDMYYLDLEEYPGGPKHKHLIGDNLMSALEFVRIL